MNLHRRLRSLERAARAQSPPVCPECAGGSPGPETYRLLPIAFDGVGRQIKHDPGPERCGKCGRRLVVRLKPIVVGGA